MFGPPLGVEDTTRSLSDPAPVLLPETFANRIIHSLQQSSVQNSITAPSRNTCSIPPAKLLHQAYEIVIAFSAISILIRRSSGGCSGSERNL